MTGTVVAISQPTFLPWLGYFSMIDAADDFVFLDDVAFSRQSWQQRNRLRGPAGLQWLTVPVDTSGRSGQLILETEIDTRHGFPRKQISTLQQLYGKSQNWGTLGEAICSHLLDAASYKSLSKLNRALIIEVVSSLGIQTRIHLSSELESEPGRSEKLASIAKHFGAKYYLATPGSGDYLHEDKSCFEAQGISLEIHQYVHPIYQQRFKPFLNSASAIDLILSDVDNPLETIRSGRLTPLPLEAHVAR